MKYKLLIVSIIILAMFILNSCNKNNQISTPSFTMTTAEEAKEMMDNDDDIIILDVRTKEEYYTGHIKDAILLPYDVIMDKAKQKLPDKSATILIYCRSGRRSKIAAEDLVSLGYTNVYEFGGIIDWPYEIE